MALKLDKETGSCGDPDAACGELCSTAAVEGCIKGFPERLKKTIGTQSVRAFAAASGLSEGTLRKYLRNETYPTLDRLIGIVDAGRVCLPWLVTGRGPMRPAGIEKAGRATTPHGLLEALEAALRKGGAASTGPLAAHTYSIDRIWDSGDDRCYILVVKARK